MKECKVNSEFLSRENAKSMANPIFVVGAPRTGTTLVRNILNRHPDVYLYNEIHFCEGVYDRLAGHRELDIELLDRAIDLLLERAREWLDCGEARRNHRPRLRQTVLEKGPSCANLMETFLEMDARHHGKSIWGDNSPQDILYLELLKSWFPGARFVCLARDPRAYLASYKSYVRRGIPTYRDRYNPLPNSLLWRTYMAAQERAITSSFGKDVFLLTYESLVTAPEEQVEALCRFLGLAFDRSMLAVESSNTSYAHFRAEPERGIKTDSLERWRNELNATEIWLVERICAHQMQRLGYRLEGRFPGLVGIPMLLKLAGWLPGRLFNLLFRTGKPLTRGKLQRVLSHLRS